MNDKLTGVLVPATTPFDDAGDLRLDWLEHNLRRWSTTNVRGIMVLGTNGEFRSVADDEARAVVATAAANRGDKTLIVGAGRESTRLTVQFIASIAEHAEAVDYVSVLPPHYFKSAMTGEALREHYLAVADQSPIPVLLYVAPSYANGVLIPPPVVASLADHPNIVGIKDTSTDQITSYLLAAGGRDDFSVLAGTMSTIMTGLLFGSPGGVVSAANFFPDECADVVRLASEGRQTEALTAYADLQRLITITGGRRGVASLKACMNLLGYRAGIPRAPVRPLDEDERRAVRDALVAHGKIVDEGGNR
ncbi:dihydrodipicolinate synthase family protein [uncultured Friedmanniella sp.]|uniref:dihydrodipicolinate synthase family protein n=1 Tax=uncultured Friedmanniella sp. TaxID=335381 RepID=UPI0035CC78D1